MKQQLITWIGGVFPFWFSSKLENIFFLHYQGKLAMSWSDAKVKIGGVCMLDLEPSWEILTTWVQTILASHTKPLWQASAAVAKLEQL